jgi:hypothetical protein
MQEQIISPQTKQNKTKSLERAASKQASTKKHSSKMKFKLHSALQKLPASVFSFICCAEIRWMSLSQKLLHLKNMHKGTKSGEGS